MCGICGIVTTGQNNLSDTLALMNKAIIHRGPDDEGCFIMDNIGLAMRRLSIIDLQTGHQPMISTDKRIVIIFNGEIYNFLELREKYLKGYTFVTHSDTEVVMNLYHKMGKRCLELLRGIFAFAVYDLVKKELFLARDHIGVKPLYYYSDDNNFLFSSDILSFHEIRFIDLSINHAVITDYLRFGYVPHPHTIFRKVHKLRPGYYAIINEKASVRINQYYKILDQMNPEVFNDFDNAKQKLQQLIHNSVSEQMVSDVPLGAFLSGGIDSSIITTEMDSVSTEPVSTFTIGFHGASNNKDLQLSALLSTKLNLNHHIRIIEPDLGNVVNKIIDSLGEPFAITSTIPIYINSTIARESVKVVLSGDGADEVFGGYSRYESFFRFKKMTWLGFLPLNLINDLAKGLTGLIRSNNLNKAYLIKLYPFITYLSQPGDLQRYLLLTGTSNDNILKEIMQDDVFQLNPVPSYALDFSRLTGPKEFNINNFMAFDVQTSLVDEMLTKVDFASMLASLEVRVPLLDHRIVEFGLSIPPGFKIIKSRNKVILKEVYKDQLPIEILSASKRGFNLPLDSWIKKYWAPSFQLVFNSPFLKELGIDKVSLNHQFEKYLSGYPVNGKIFYYVFILISWYENLKHKRRLSEV